VAHLKRTLNLETNQHPLFEPHVDDSKKNFAERCRLQHIKENQRVNWKLMRDYTHIKDMRITKEFKDLNSQEYSEEIILFGAVGARFFQGIPTYQYV
jgi:3-deoxy-D-arabino-heptulosonate 7-phosphate (DAHP) synthase